MRSFLPFRLKLNTWFGRLYEKTEPPNGTHRWWSRKPRPQSGNGALHGRLIIERRVNDLFCLSNHREWFIETSFVFRARVSNSPGGLTAKGRNSRFLHI